LVLRLHIERPKAGGDTPGITTEFLGATRGDFGSLLNASPVFFLKGC
jgi:hypothetical protein